MVDIAEDKLMRYKRQQKLVSRTEDPEIYFIADYLRRNSRKRDNRHYAITFRELDQRLKYFGYCLANPHNNYIDVCRIEERKSFILFGKKKPQLYKVAQIGFPGWKRQVRRGAIYTVRKETKLTKEKGVDSEAFFHGADPLYSLISEYSGPLERLANR